KLATHLKELVLAYSHKNSLGQLLNDVVTIFLLLALHVHVLLKKKKPMIGLYIVDNFPFYASPICSKPFVCSSSNNASIYSSNLPSKFWSNFWIVKRSEE